MGKEYRKAGDDLEISEIVTEEKTERVGLDHIDQNIRDIETQLRYWKGLRKEAVRLGVKSQKEIKI